MKIRLTPDNDPQDPRGWNNAGIMVCWHNSLGDKHHFSGLEAFMEELALETDPSLEDHIERLRNVVYDRLADKWGGEFNVGAAIERKITKLTEGALAKYVILPIYLDDHGGLSVDAKEFGQVGFIFCEDRENAEESLKREVSIYSDYLAGHVWRLIIEDGNEIEAIGGLYVWAFSHSRWGLYGKDTAKKCVEDYIRK